MGAYDGDRWVVGLTCPRCFSDEVHSLPADWVSRHPGYRCLDCRLRMTSRGMRVVYAIVGVLAAGFTGLSIWSLVEGGLPRMLLIAPVVLAYCLWQFFLPLPIQDRHTRS